MEAIASGDITTARNCLQRLEQLLGLGEDLAFYSGLLAQAGDADAADILKRILTTNRTVLSDEVLKSALSNLVSFYVLTDREKEGLEVLKPIIEELLMTEEMPPETEAFYLNQTQKLRYGCREYELALKDAERCIELNPNEPAYFFNLSLIYQRLNLAAKAVEMVDRYMKLPNPSDSGLSHAVELYAEVGRVEDARTVFITLKEKNPSKANRLLFGDSTLRSLLSPS
jgi:tetratricopeptide (TPR) repeat protein